MRRPCLKCGKRDPNRSQNARYCLGCVGDLKCELCDKPHGKKAGSKYCVECFAKVPHMLYHPKEMRRVPVKEWRGPSYLGFTPTDMDWARMAAYIDGEGAISLSPRRTNTGFSQTFCGKVIVTNTDIRLAEWCKATFGMKYFGHGRAWAGERSAKWKPCWFAQASSFKAAWILHNCLPWFLLKREQAEVVIEHQASTIPDMFVRAQGNRTPGHVLEYRAMLKSRLTELNRRGPVTAEGIEMKEVIN